MKTLEMAHADELMVCSRIISEGKEFQREQGFVQWTDDYPNIETIRNDIQNGKGYVIKVNRQIAGYMCIDFDGEPAYEHIQGQWKTSTPYAVVHRLAFSKDFRGTGLADIVFRLIEELCLSRSVKNIRVDTDFPNTRMQHILEKNGFTKCGTVIFQGSGKIAYDKILNGKTVGGYGIHRMFACHPTPSKKI